MRANDASNQISLFAAEENSGEETYQPNRSLFPEWPVTVRLSHEREALGFYLSGHPLEKFRNDLIRLGCATISNLKQYSDGTQVTVAGVITFLKLKNTKKGDRYATFILEDLLGTVEVIVWPDTYQRVVEVVNSEDPVVVTARLDASDERRILIANSIESAIEIRDRSAKEARIMLKDCDAQKLEKLKALFSAHRGDCPVRLVVRKDSHSETVLSLPQELSVEPSEQLCNRVEELFGDSVMTFR